jgi:acyl-CoA synthetase (AMP-forming)/AMP-acid ligase II
VTAVISGNLYQVLQPRFPAAAEAPWAKKRRPKPAAATCATETTTAAVPPVTAAVVRQNKAAGVALTEAAIIKAVKGNLASSKVPKRGDFVDDLPRTAMGKVQKRRAAAAIRLNRHPCTPLESPVP